MLGVSPSALEFTGYGEIHEAPQQSRAEQSTAKSEREKRRKTNSTAIFAPPNHTYGVAYGRTLDVPWPNTHYTTHLIPSWTHHTPRPFTHIPAFPRQTPFTANPTQHHQHTNKHLTAEHHTPSSSRTRSIFSFSASSKQAQAWGTLSLLLLYRTSSERGGGNPIVSAFWGRAWMCISILFFSLFLGDAQREKFSVLFSWFLGRRRVFDDEILLCVCVCNDLG